MGNQDNEAYLEALERELHGYEVNKNTERAAGVKAEIGRLRKVLKAAGPVETAAAAPAETTGVTADFTAPPSAAKRRKGR